MTPASKGPLTHPGHCWGQLNCSDRSQWACPDGQTQGPPPTSWYPDLGDTSSVWSLFSFQNPLITNTLHTDSAILQEGRVLQALPGSISLPLDCHMIGP